MSERVASGQSQGRGRLARVLLWALQILLALAFAAAGLSKLFGQEAMVEMFSTIGIGQWFRYVVGVLEISGAIGLLIPRLSGLAALGLICVMVGAILTNIFILGASVVLPAVYLLLCAAVVYGRRTEIRALLASR